MNRHGNLQKYRNPNPLQKFLLTRFLHRISNLAEGLGAKRVLDCGSAEGFVLNRLLSERCASEGIGIDIDREALERGRQLHPSISFLPASAFACPFKDDSFDLVLCTEVLEHVVQPERVLNELSRVTRRYVLLSVPHEPFFRAANFLRGKHVRRLGNDPEHIHNWTA
ncbi:MAG: class I SAM-dependent methyltransferase, partial [Candidatus Micrarchaeota archaeon]